MTRLIAKSKFWNDMRFVRTNSSRPLSELVTESSTLRLITLIAFFLRSQFDWTNNVLTQNSNLLGRTLSDVKKKFFLGKKTLRYNLLMRGFNERELEELWNIIYNLFSEMEQLLQFLHKHFKLLEQLLSLFTFYAYFSVFPNAFRHSCTTMPWTIWPSLAILWGVCWMFYGTPPGYEADPVAQIRNANFSFEMFDGKLLFQARRIVLTSLQILIGILFLKAWKLWRTPTFFEIPMRVHMHGKIMVCRIIEL